VRAARRRGRPSDLTRGEARAARRFEAGLAATGGAPEALALAALGGPSPRATRASSCAPSAATRATRPAGPGTTSSPIARTREPGGAFLLDLHGERARPGRIATRSARRSRCSTTSRTSGRPSRLGATTFPSTGWPRRGAARRPGAPRCRPPCAGVDRALDRCDALLDAREGCPARSLPPPRGESADDPVARAAAVGAAAAGRPARRPGRPSRADFARAGARARSRAAAPPAPAGRCAEEGVTASPPVAASSPRRRCAASSGAAPPSRPGCASPARPRGDLRGLRLSAARGRHRRRPGDAREKREACDWARRCPVFRRAPRTRRGRGAGRRRAFDLPGTSST
jgi:hypothetical protein